RLALSAVVSAESIRQVLDRQRVPGDWAVSVFDGAGFRVARSRDHESYAGRQAGPSLHRLMGAGEDEGSGVTYTLDGDEVLTSYARLARGGWSAAIGIAPAVLMAPAYSSLAAYGGGILLSIALGMLA